LVSLEIGLQALPVLAKAAAHNLFHAAIMQVDAGTKFCHDCRQTECVSPEKPKEVSRKRKTAQPRDGNL
jgi:Na+-translocating ferredoxin:NAD+ oxidoreductase RNF subunit RnfB